MRLIRLFCLLCVVVVAAGCGRLRGTQPEAIPTRVTDLDALATAQFMTQNAPPEGFREAVSFPLIDDNLTLLSNWSYEVFMSFDGVFSRTPRQVSAETRAQVWFNDLGPERRVVIEGRGELFGQDEETDLEGVRLGGDTFLVRDKVCLGDAGGEAAIAADLRAGELIGGVQRGIPSGINATINGQRVWRYEFTVDDLNLPQVRLADDGRITSMTGELWVAPGHNAVIRYYVNLDVENVVIFDSALPVTGQIIIRYDLYDIGINPNITQPFGC